MNSRWPKFDKKKKHIVDQVNFLDLFSAQFSVKLLKKKFERTKRQLYLFDIF